MKIAPSMLAADYTNLANELSKVPNSDFIHLDIMDGHFVPNISFGPAYVKSLRPLTDIVFDVHLMVNYPTHFLTMFKDAGADIFNFHVECKESAEDVIHAITELDMKPAMTVKPKTPIDTIFPYANDLYMVLVMTVEPGFGGQSMMVEQLEKVKILKEKFPHLLVQVDGGIGRDNIALCKDAGVDICVAGTSVFMAENPEKEIEYLQNI